MLGSTKMYRGIFIYLFFFFGDTQISFRGSKNFYCWVGPTFFLSFFLWRSNIFFLERFLFFFFFQLQIFFLRGSLKNLPQFDFSMVRHTYNIVPRALPSRADSVLILSWKNLDKITMHSCGGKKQNHWSFNNSHLPKGFRDCVQPE